MSFVIGIRLRNEIGDVRYTPVHFIGFKKMLAETAEPIVEDIRKKLASSNGALHADETHWTTDGVRSYFRVQGDEKFVDFQYDTTRAG